jgi:hypothetical protein
VIGSPNDMKAVGKVESHIADALKKGAKVVSGGKRAAHGGSFFEPTMLTDAMTDMVITREETFGPVARSPLAPTGYSIGVRLRRPGGQQNRSAMRRYAPDAAIC